jgi:hypothetical protein
VPADHALDESRTGSDDRPARRERELGVVARLRFVLAPSRYRASGFHANDLTPNQIHQLILAAALQPIQDADTIPARSHLDPASSDAPIPRTAYASGWGPDPIGGGASQSYGGV